jgi:hypothetical protein
MTNWATPGAAQNRAVPFGASKCGAVSQFEFRERFRIDRAPASSILGATIESERGSSWVNVADQRLILNQCCSP